MHNDTQPAFNLKRITIRLNGEAPLICPRVRAPEEFLTPQEEYLRSLRSMGDGRYGFPSDGIYSALSSASGRSLGGLLNIFGGDLIEIEGTPTARTDRVSDVASPITCRAQFYPWALVIRVQFNAARITESEVVHMFERVGFDIGIGSHRPERGGTFGIFSVTVVRSSSGSALTSDEEESRCHADSQESDRTNQARR